MKKFLLSIAAVAAVIGADAALPETGNVVVSFYDGNGGEMNGWGADVIERAAVEDGKPCILLTNNAAKANPWDAQTAIELDETPLNAGTTYYISFDVKGTAAATGFDAGIQNKEDYSGKGGFSKFDITTEWKHNIISGECTGTPANRITFNLGHYVGTCYMTNVKLYTADESGIADTVIDTPVTRWVVYNLQGIKVMDVDNEAALSTLDRGIYIVNGKKAVLGN